METYDKPLVPTQRRCAFARGSRGALGKERTMTKSLLTVILGIALTGIGSVSVAGSKDERPEIYIVSITSTGTHLEIIGVDGERKAFFFKKKLRVSAGPHQLQLRTGNLKSLDRTDNRTYQGKIQFEFDAKNGHTYTFALQPDTWGISANTQACLYEEPTDDPKAKKNIFGEFRNPGPNAQQVTCVPLNAEAI
jgi:hypothetical protein